MRKIVNQYSKVVFHIDRKLQTINRNYFKNRKRENIFVYTDYVGTQGEYLTQTFILTSYSKLRINDFSTYHFSKLL